MIDIQKIAANFPNREIPELIIKFYGFVASGKPSGFLDYEEIENPVKYLKNFVNENIINDFVPFFVDSTHSCYAVWLVEEVSDINEMPVVLFSDEGIFSVTSKNLEEFFYLLSLTLNRDIASIISSNASYKKRGLDILIDDPYRIYNDLKLKEIDAYSILNYSDYLPFRKFISTEMKINITENPVKLVEAAFNSFPNVEEYIRKNNGFIIDPESRG